MTSSDPIPQRIRREAGPLPAEHAVDRPDPFETMAPVRDGRIVRDGVATYYAAYGEQGPWLVFSPTYQIVHSSVLKANVPYLARHFRVLVMDLRGNGRSDRPDDPAAYSLDAYFADVVGVLDALEIERCALVGISATTMLSIRLAAEQPERVSHLIVIGGFAERTLKTPAAAEATAAAYEVMRNDWPRHLDEFFTTLFTEPHSTKQYEDGVRWGWATEGRTVAMGLAGWTGHDLRELAKQIRCPTLVIHGDDDRRIAYAKGREVHALVPGARMLTIAAGGHLPMCRDPVVVNRAIRDFVGASARESTWTRAMSRRRRALFISSPIGLGHVQRDLAIARELRKLQPDLDIDWFTVDPAARYLQQEGERLHPITSRLANESRHFEQVAGEHDLHAFFALRTMDEVMANNFMTFADLVESEHYDIVIGDEAWDVDYYYHENPELKRQPFVFLTDFVGCLPMDGDEREAFLCADRNADDIEHVARFPWIRDRAIFVGNPEDVTDASFGPGLPQIRDWTDRNFCYTGYALPFDPAALADTDALRARHGYGQREKIAIAAVGGTAVGRHLLHRIARAFPLMKREVPQLRMILVAGPRLAPESFPQHPGLEVRPYVHNLFEHLACCDLALVQGGLSTCMELVATRRPFVSFPLQRHFEQCVHVRNRLHNYCADCAVNYRDIDDRELAHQALQRMFAPVRYKPVETDGAARAARVIADVMENRSWVGR
ncbi:MAG TPA: alpha/beta fold hydrolase [Burkholderiaceae bacterium]|nr:alpha/beta fold hydrolase [Burkholderiaceae bacterium]